MGATNSKSIFRSIITTLITTDINPTDHNFWDDLWKINLTLEEIFELISPDEIRLMIKNRIQNVKTIFTQAVAQLYQVVETPYSEYFDQALNCARILCRFLPLMLEDNGQFIMDVFWRQQMSLVLTSDSDETSNTTDENNNTNDSFVDNEDDTEPLAVILMNSIFHLLFLPNFTIPDNETNMPKMWALGIGSLGEQTIVSSTQYDTNRIEILQIMIAAFSETLYDTTDSYDSCANHWLEVATNVDIPNVSIFFNSLMNTALGYDPVGWGFLSFGSDTAKPLMESSIQCLIILLDYGVSNVGPSELGFNVYRSLMSKIVDMKELNFMFKGFTRLLNYIYKAKQDSASSYITNESELLIFLWKCMEEIPVFLPYILDNCDITEILTPLMYFMIEGRKDHNRVGLIYLCTFLLLKLSGERNFGVSLNKSHQLTYLGDISNLQDEENFSNILIIVIHKMIVSGLEKFSALYNCFLTIICNISPYCVNLSSVASVKLVNLLQLFTQPKLINSSDGSYLYIHLLVESLNNIVQYQYKDNSNLIYSIVRRKEVIEVINQLNISIIKIEKELKNTKDVENINHVISPKISRDISISSSPLRSTDRNQEIKEPYINELIPINTLMRLVQHLLPKVLKLTETDTSITEIKIIEFIKSYPIVGLLPVPHPILIRKYQANQYTSLWFTSFLWGVLFMRNPTTFNGLNVKLFVVEKLD